jgi:hypothetical protein
MERTMFGSKKKSLLAPSPIRGVVSDVNCATLVIEFSRIHLMGELGCNNDRIDSATLIDSLMGKALRETVIGYKTPLAAFKFLTNYKISNQHCEEAILAILTDAGLNPKIHAFSITDVTVCDAILAEMEAAVAMRVFKSNMRKLSRFIRDNPDVALSSVSTVGAQNLFDLYNKYILKNSAKI